MYRGGALVYHDMIGCVWRMSTIQHLKIGKIRYVSYQSNMKATNLATRKSVTLHFIPHSYFSIL